jgi:hypothetical protein
MLVVGVAMSLFVERRRAEEREKVLGEWRSNVIVTLGVLVCMFARIVA